MNRSIIKDICMLLEKERDFDDKVVTNMTELSRKIKTKATVKDVTLAVNTLVDRGLVSILEKNKRKTVLKINEDLLGINEDSFNKEEIDLAKAMGITITPKRLMEYLNKISEDNRCVVRSKDLINYFDCTYMVLMKIFNSLQEKGKLDYTFSDGTLDIKIHSEETLEVKDITEEKLIENSGIVSGLDDDFDTQLNEMFDDIGENIFSIIEYCKTLEAQNKEMQDKLERCEIILQRKTNECSFFESQVEQLKEKNNRLFKENISLRVGNRA